MSLHWLMKQEFSQLLFHEMDKLKSLHLDLRLGYW